MASKDFFKRFLLYFVIILIVNFCIDLLFLSKERTYQYGIVKRDTTADLRIKKELIRGRFDIVFDDLEFLKRYLRYSMSSGKSVEEIGRELVRYVATFGEIRSRYRNIYIVDANGEEILRVKYFLGHFKIIPGEELRNVVKEPCYSGIKNLGEDEYLFLGFEKCEGENGLETNAVFKFATSIYTYGGKKVGTLVVEYYADRILKELNRFFYYLDNVTYLLDSDENIIYYVTPSELESHFLKREHILSENFKKIYPGISEKMKKGSYGDIESEGNLYTYAYINIPGRGKRTVGVNFVERWKRWQLVSVTDLHRVIKPSLIKYGFKVGLGSIIVLLFVGLFLALYVWSDIKRKLVERSLREEASFFRNTPFPVLKTDRAGFVLGYNEETYKCFDRDLVGLSVINLFKGFVEEIFKRLKEGKSVKFEEELKERRYVFTVIRDAETDNCFFYGNDITDLKEKEKELRVLSKAIEQSDETILITDAEGVIVYVNNAVRALTGYHPKEIIGKTPRIFKSGQMSDDFYRDFWATITSGKTWEGEFLNRRKDGKLYWEKAIVTPVRNERGEIVNFIAVKEDNSIKKETEIMLQEAKRKAEESSKLKTLFLANMSHEIRTPLNAVLGFTQLLLEKEDDKEKLEQLSIIKSSGEYLLRLINDILDLSRIEADRLELNYAPFSVKRLVEGVKSMFGIKAGEKGIEFYVEIDKNSPEWVVGDEHRIRQIVLNLLGNAIKFTDSGYVKLNYGYGEGNIVFSVEDTGIGIDSEGLKQIFTPFKQLDESLTKKYQGAGLGLSITKRLVGLMGGDIEVYSEPGKGSRFTVWIPAEIVETPAPSPDISVERQGKKQMGVVTEIDGRAMVNKWIVAMEKEGLKEILLKGIKKLGEKFRALSVAMDREDIEEIRLLSHEMKGFTGSLKMEEIYQRVLKIEEEAFKDNYDLKVLKELVFELERYVKSIPSDYFGKEYFMKGDKMASGDNREREGFNILVVEDNSVNLMLIVKLLERMGVRCDTAENGKIALERMRTRNYNLVLLDINMPVMDGVETLKVMRDEGFLETTYVIALTAYAMKGEAERYMAMGFNDYISKPIDTGLFEEKILRLMNQFGGGKDFSS